MPRAVLQPEVEEKLAPAPGEHAASSVPEPPAADVVLGELQIPLLQHTLCALTARGSMLAARGIGLVLISRQLGVVHFGAYALLLATYNIVLSVAAFGLEQANLYLAGRHPRRVAALVGNSLVLGAGLGLLGSGVLIAAAALVEQRVFAEAPRSGVVLCALAIPVAVLHNALAGIAVGLGRFRYYGTLETLKWTAYLGVVGVLYARGTLGPVDALGAFFAVLALAAVVHVVGLTVFASGLPRCDLALAWRTLSLGRSMLLVQLSHVLSLRLDVYAARVFGSSALVGHYALASNLGEILLYVARSFSLVVFSGAARGSHTNSLRLRTLVHWILLAAVVLCTALLVVRQELLRLLFGETAEGCMPILALRLPGIVAGAITVVLCGELLGRGRPNVLVRGNLLAISILALLVWPLMAWNPAPGAALAFSGAAVAQLIWIGARGRSLRE